MDHVLQRRRGLGDRHSPPQRPTGTIPTGCVPSRGSRRTGDRSSRVTPEGEADEAGHAWSVFTGGVPRGQRAGVLSRTGPGTPGTVNKLVGPLAWPQSLAGGTCLPTEPSLLTFWTFTGNVLSCVLLLSFAGAP